MAAHRVVLSTVPEHRSRLRMPRMGSDDIVTVTEASRILRCSPATVRRYDGWGVLPSTRASNGMRLWLRSTVEDFRAVRTAIGQDSL
jgi:hypothetical protein